MAEPKWTPGPLEIGWEEWTPGDSLTIHCEGAMVAEVYGYDEFPCFDAEDEDACDEFNARQKADANRFAAAPDLYEACALAKKYLEPDLVEPGRTVFWTLVAALSKARGEAVTR